MYSYPIFRLTVCSRQRMIRRNPVTVRKDDASAATQAATAILAASLPFSDGGGLIQTTSG
jgi:hypothetical protein